MMSAKKRSTGFTQELRSGEVDMRSRLRAEPLSDRRRLVGGVVVHDQARSEFGRDMALDLAQEAQELASAMTRIATAR